MSDHPTFPTEEILSFEDILPKPTPVIGNVEAYYQLVIKRIAQKHRNMINTYNSDEFREVKAWLRQAVGNVIADEIMDRNL